MKRHPTTRSAFSRLSVAAAVAGVLGTTMLAPPAGAHPHIWISVETTVLIENGSVVGVRHRWSFDEFYAAMAIHGLDTNRDGIYSREELAELAQVNITALKDQAYYTFARLGDKALEFGAPKDYFLTHGVPPPDSKPVASPRAAVAAVEAATREPAPEPGIFGRVWNRLFGASTAAPAAPEPAKVLALEFTLPLKQPVLVEAPDFTVSVRDPEWYIAFELAGDSAVKLGPGAPPGCRVDLGDAAKPADDDVQRITDAFAGQLGGRGVVAMTGAKLIRLNCESKS